VRRSLLFSLLAAAGLTLTACGGSDTSSNDEYAALCDVSATLGSGDIAATNDDFLDGAHQGLHDLSTELADTDRDAATELLTAVERFESHVAAGDDAEATAQSLDLLMFEVEGAYEVLGVPAEVSCVDEADQDTESILNAEVASYDLAAGSNERLLVGVFGNDLTFLSFGSIELELSHGGEFVSTHEARFLPVPDHAEPVGTAPGSPRLTRPSEGRGVYEAMGVEFTEPGIWEVTVSANVEGETVSATTAFEVADEHAVFMAGELVPRTVNPLPGDSEIVPNAIDSRADATGTVPDPSLHEATIASYIDTGQPLVVVVSTPVFCVSRFCGPITDAVEDLTASYNGVGFVHLEVWEDFASNSLNDFTLEWIWPGQQGEPGEPWVFLVSGDGLLIQRWDNVLDLAELESGIVGAVGDL
jgi:hypothetical protein